MSTVIALPQRLFSAKFRNPPVKPKNKDRRTREFLTPSEMEKLLKAARKTGRYGDRDSTLLLIMYHHGLRVSEAISLRWEQIDFKQALLYVKRKKNGTPSNHPLTGDEIRALRKLQRDCPDSSYIFTSERGSPLTSRTVHHIVFRAGKEAGFDFPCHPHSLRHSCGYALANKGVDTRSLQSYMGHRNINNTVIYTELSPARFKNFWQD